MNGSQTFPLSGALMAKMQTREISLKPRYRGYGEDIRKVHYLKQSAPEAFAMLRALREEQTDTAAAFRRYLPAYGQEWHGITDRQRPADAIATGAFTSATARFQTAQRATLQKPLTRGAFRASPVGSSFDIGKYLTGNPICALHRPRTKLPLVALRFGLSAACTISAEAIAKSCVAIARAAWEYRHAGGIVSVSVSFACGYAAKRDGASGFVWELDIPLQNLGLFASSLSTEFFRALYIPVAQTLSGRENDALFVMEFEKGVQTLSGTKSDAQALSVLKVKE